MKGVALVVDDESLVRWTLKRILEEEGWDVCDVESRREAERLCGTVTFDLLVADYRLDDGAGIDWIGGVRNRGFKGRLLVITAEPHGVTEEIRARLGIAAVLEKPLSPADMRRALASTGANTADEKRLSYVGGFLSCRLPGNCTEESVRHVTGSCGDAPWVLFDAVHTVAIDQGAMKILRDVAARCASMGGSVCFAGVVPGLRESVARGMSPVAFEMEESLDDIAALGRKTMSRRERAMVMESCVGRIELAEAGGGVAAG